MTTNPKSKNRFNVTKMRGEDGNTHPRRLGLSIILVLIMILSILNVHALANSVSNISEIST